jgi:K+-transporting ATPase KdpF subunit
MTALLWIAGFVSVGLFVYLVVAMLWPEKLQ